MTRPGKACRPHCYSLALLGNIFALVIWKLQLNSFLLNFFTSLGSKESNCAAEITEALFQFLQSCQLKTFPQPGPVGTCGKLFCRSDLSCRTGPLWAETGTVARRHNCTVMLLSYNSH